MNTFLLKSKNECKAVKWVQSALSRDPVRATLTGIFIDGEDICGADGDRLHIANTPDGFDEYDGKIIKPLHSVSVNPRIEEVEIIQGNYPDYTPIIPTGKPVYKIALDKKFLADLKNMPGDDTIILEFTKPTHPIKITCKGDDGEVASMAIIMPMHIRD